jgi:hypothetical protein
MKRDKEIEQIALEEYPVRKCQNKKDSGEYDSNLPRRRAFTKGVIWADNNPESKYNLSDTDLVRSILESIEDTAQRTTTGNVAHNARAIMILARNALSYIKKV